MARDRLRWARSAAALLGLLLLVAVTVPALADDDGDDGDDEPRKGKGHRKARVREAPSDQPLLPLGLGDLLDRVAQEPANLDQALEGLRERHHGPSPQFPQPKPPSLEPPHVEVPEMGIGPPPALAMAGGVALAAAKHLIVVGAVGGAAALLWLAHRPRPR